MPEQNTDKKNRLDDILKVAGVFVTLGTFVWGMWTYSDTTRQQGAREQRESVQQEETRKFESARESQIRRVEATKPFLERQLTLYTEASKVAASLATTTDQNEKTRMRRRFLQLYLGELALVENPAVESAMVQFKSCMDAGCSSAELTHRSLAIAHACRDSLAISWGVEEWKTPQR